MYIHVIFHILKPRAVSKKIIKRIKKKIKPKILIHIYIYFYIVTDTSTTVYSYTDEWRVFLRRTLFVTSRSSHYIYICAHILTMPFFFFSKIPC